MNPKNIIIIAIRIELNMHEVSFMNPKIILAIKLYPHAFNLGYASKENVKYIQTDYTLIKILLIKMSLVIY
jgi:hypothetical protein